MTKHSAMFPHLAENIEIEPLAPDPYHLVEAIRHIGYNLNEALCDVIDNSLDAGATSVDVTLDWNASLPLIAIADDGYGMTEGELLRALSPGVIDSRSERSTGSLGRFGLGLKSASLSQANALTVFSKKDGAVSYLRWVTDSDDLPILEEREAPARARLERSFTSSAHRHAERALSNIESGTIVIWERLAIAGPMTASKRAFVAALERIEAYLALTYHQFLQRRDAPIRMRLNGVDIQPIDPESYGHSPRRIAPVLLERDSSHARTRARGILLSHASPEDRDQLSLDSGLYIYRNGRLVVRGGWSGIKDLRDLAHRERIRILIELDASHDDAWGINIAKSSVAVPDSAKTALVAYATSISQIAKDSLRVAIKRGVASIPPKTEKESPRTFAIVSERNAAARRTSLAPSHPLTTAFQAVVPPDQWETFLLLLELLVVDIEARTAFHPPEPLGLETIHALKSSVESAVDSGSVSQELENPLLQALLSHFHTLE